MRDIHNTGFTLLELLITLAILGILAAIAIPQFARYREQTYCSLVESDVRNAVGTLEAHYTETGSYTGYTPVNSQGVILFPGVSAQKVTWLIAFHARCPKGFFLFLSFNGEFRWV